MTELKIQTKRFLLRKPRLSDASAIFNAYAQDDLVVRYLVWQKHADIEATRQFLAYCVAQWDSGESQPLVIEACDAQSAVGIIDLRRIGHRVNLGYVLTRSYWGSGCMSEVCAAVVEHLFSTDPSTFRIEAVCDVENVASARVMEKIGMKHEGLLPTGPGGGKNPNPDAIEPRRHVPGTSFGSGNDGRLQCLN
jgi:ribosomal-protein-alanine N-acetyltransferase